MTKAMLIDLTRCIGCRGCQAACKQWHDLPGEKTHNEGSYQNPMTVTDKTLTTVTFNEVKHDGQFSWVFAKRQCMHCEHPGCASACTVGALRKTPDGPVVYDADKCIGCRYCMIACPFEVPRFEWNNGLTPVIGKCQFCAQQRLFKGLPPGCVEACPTGALKFGRRDDLLFEAKSRLRSRPDVYVDHVYGEEEVGGTSWMYISDVPFEKLGFKQHLPKRPLPTLTWDVVSWIPGIVAVLASLFGVLAFSLSRKNPHGTPEDKS